MPPLSVGPGRTSARPALAKHDAALAEVVGGHFHPNPVAHDRADAEFPHLPGRIGDDPVFVLEHDAKAPVGKNFIDLAVEGQQILLGHGVRPLRG